MATKQKSAGGEAAAGRVQAQLGYGVESVCSRFKQAGVDDGVTAGGSANVMEFHQEVKALSRANEILYRAATFGQITSANPLLLPSHRGFAIC